MYFEYKNNNVIMFELCGVIFYLYLNDKKLYINQELDECWKIKFFQSSSSLCVVYENFKNVDNYMDNYHFIVGKNNDEFNSLLSLLLFIEKKTDVIFNYDDDIVAIFPSIDSKEYKRISYIVNSRLINNA